MPSTKRSHSDNRISENLKEKSQNLSDFKLNHTLYIKNLNNKINKSQLKHTLYLLFSTFDDILSIRFGSNVHEAFIVFSNSKAATLAMRSLQNEKLYGKEMLISFSTHESKIIESLKDREVKDEDENDDDDSVLPTYD
ncbi:uncharacterized protein KGF55_002523 [Candida pseudojiufengensis]|uniref:uncharacterized protein n=1 Tax=Candida pseudojiufengensis TaxID=497109 RepID=UPI002224AC2A|nr:uncharacterized protein KGF55_002523 [Candida pseudojiufengensis]KAI5963643.1 hypothetical protein KGF55_002523 [Candida pseudojiufengensis]